MFKHATTNELSLMQSLLGPGDGRSISYVALLQPHLDVIQVFLRDVRRIVDTTDLPTRLELVNDPAEKEKFIVSLSSEIEGGQDVAQQPQMSTSIILPSPVELKSRFVTASFSDGIFDFKITASRSPVQAIPNAPRLSAKELQQYAADNIRCRFCATALITVGANASARPIFRPLPSPHYQELIEAYLCHPSGEFAKKMDSVGEKGFWPEETAVDGQVKPVVLVGETELRADARYVEEWLRLPESDLVSASLVTIFYSFSSLLPILHYPRVQKKVLSLPLTGNQWQKDRYKSPKMKCCSAKVMDRVYYHLVLPFIVFGSGG